MSPSHQIQENSTYKHIQKMPKNVYTSEGPKKCIHILRDVIYVKCVYIFWHPLYIYIFITEGAKKCIHIRGCQIMYTHFKRCYLCKMCIHFLAPSVYIHIYVQRLPTKCIHIRGCQTNVYKF